MRDDKMHPLIFFAFKYSHDVAFMGFLAKPMFGVNKPLLILKQIVDVM
jgi:hypothetical protein